MFTVKLRRFVEHEIVEGQPSTGVWQTKIVSAFSVDVFDLRVGLKEISCQYDRDGLVRNDAFYIGHLLPRPEGFSDETDFWQIAYIENEQGATTEVVRP